MTTKYVGAYKRGRHWYAKITFQNVTHSLGRFKNEKAAGEAYQKAKKVLEDQRNKGISKDISKTRIAKQKATHQLDLFEK